VFSPYYALARRFGDGDPLNHCALNVALYGRSSKLWALTERTRKDLTRDKSTLHIGPSALHWNGDTLTVEIDEVTAPFPSRIKGKVSVHAHALADLAFNLGEGGRHSWHPIAPCAHIDVTLDRPQLRWSGQAYLDCNFGDEPLEAAFVEWDWGRAQSGDDTLVLYDIAPRDGDPLSLALRFDPRGGIATSEAPPRANLPQSFWRVARKARSADGAPRLLKTLEDTPFYARSLVGATIGGKSTLFVHESLSLNRVANPIVRAMLPFRMPRRRWRKG
jgi:carotenoid 1,2-hydratase